MTKYSTHPAKKYKKKKITEDHYFHIIDGRYKGVDFTFGDIRVRTVKDAEAVVTFDFDILYSPYKKVNAEAFTKVLEDILNQELLKLAETTEDDIIPNDTPTLTLGEHTEEFDPTEIIA